MYVYINYNNCFTPALPIKTINDGHDHHDDHFSLILIVHIHNIKQMQLLLYLIQGMHFKTIKSSELSLISPSISF